MVKTIKGFVFGQPKRRAFSIHLADKEYSITFLANEGDALIQEGNGKDRIPRACIPGKVIQSVVLEKGKKIQLIINFDSPNGPDKFIAGIIEDPRLIERAQKWLAALNVLYKRT